MFCLSLLLINQSIISANAIPIGAILKGLKGGSKIFKGGSKVIKPGSKIFGSGAGDDILKKIDDIKINKSGKEHKPVLSYPAYVTDLKITPIGPAIRAG